MGVPALGRTRVITVAVRALATTMGETHEAPLLAPPPPPPPPMTHAKMMAEMLAAHRESAHAMELLAQSIGGFTHGGQIGRAHV